MTPRPRVLLVGLLALCFALIALDGRDGSPFDPLRRGVAAVLGPVDRGVGGAVASVGSALGSLGDRDDADRLREENDRLRRQLAAGEADGRIAREWRSLLGLVEPEGWTVVPARVVGAGQALGFARTVTVDVGSRDGVTEGQPVVAGAGLVGRTVQVGPWTSVVLLLDDPAFGVGARLADTGALGLASGEGNGRLRWVQVDGGDVAVGATLLTAGSDTFAADLPVGRVTGSAPTAGGLTVAADVEPFVDPGRVDVVGVVVAAARSEPRAPLP
ncbi:MAG TPA: rod shape-determining protein MreC [Mycobacteriales bacterium]|nr:rod shape-determining protein MreC [Mycobacteriales bacterium]